MAAATVALYASPVASLRGSEFSTANAQIDQERRACSLPLARNIASSSSALFSPSKNLSLRLSRNHVSKAVKVKGVRKPSPVVMTMAPPRPPADPDMSKSEGEPSLGIEEALQTDGGEEQQPEQGQSDDAFVWRDHWYPVSLIEDLDPSVPTPFQLLGRELVVWKDPQGEWRVFLDKCPHRLAPLSCSYHGWAFKGDGSCSAIPQAAASGPESKAKFSPRACAVSYPTQVSQGLLFVWPDEKGWEKAAQASPPMLPPEFSDPKYSTVTIQRDLYYGYDTLMENVSDPSHIDFAHHKVTGRRDRAKPLPFKVHKSGPWGFAGANNDTPTISTGFYPPCYYYNKIELPVKLPILGDQKWEILICSFNIPMAPGKTRSIVCSARNFFQFLTPGDKWWQLVPRWYEHWTSNKVYDGDMIVLQGQEKIFLAHDGDINAQYGKLTFTPTQADRFVLAFRNWLRRHGKGGPEWFPEARTDRPLPSTVLSKRQMLDRYEQHTLNCSSCRNAQKYFQLWQKIFWGSTIVLAAAAGVPADMVIRALLASGSVLSAAAAYTLKEGEKNFIFKEYIHSEIE
ncbi:pheophorbide a oxygenase, chloroplastic isoform X2 [Physcomitrium patens]|uniref:pheophorbide a oxygenase, chloroplastic isoform X2 n=1 Tax=Physcomitrium patens TaxID=3218 RepID=UPI003CCDDEF3